MTDLIRQHDGRETPGPGRWTIAPGHPVHVDIGSWGRRRSTARTITGSLLITEAGAMAFRLIVDWSISPGRASTTLTYQSITIAAGSRTVVGSSTVRSWWPVDCCRPAAACCITASSAVP